MSEEHAHEEEVAADIGGSSVESLRHLLDPQTHKQQLEMAKVELKKKLSSWFVELDTVRDNPEVPDENKNRTVEQFESLIKDAAWRIAAIDDMLRQGEEAAVAAVGGPRRTPLSAVRPQG